jgi:hypothetical protein
MYQYLASTSCGKVPYVSGSFSVLFTWQIRFLPYHFEDVCYFGRSLCKWRLCDAVSLHQAEPAYISEKRHRDIGAVDFFK